MDNKELQRKRMITYFVEATCKIIDTEGIENVTVRKVANLAGYNSATLYNYFDNLTHLIFFASLRHLKNYAIDLPRYLKSVSSPLENYLTVLRCFSFHSYMNPHFYRMMFFSGFDSDMVNSSISSYYSIFAEELNESIREYIPMFIDENMHMRDYQALKHVAQSGQISEDDVMAINEMNVLIYRGMLDRMMHNIDNISVDEAVQITMCYAKRTLMAYGVAKEELDAL